MIDSWLMVLWMCYCSELGCKWCHECRMAALWQRILGFTSNFLCVCVGERSERLSLISIRNILASVIASFHSHSCILHIYIHQYTHFWNEKMKRRVLGWLFVSHEFALKVNRNCTWVVSLILSLFLFHTQTQRHTQSLVWVDGCLRFVKAYITGVV